MSFQRLNDTVLSGNIINRVLLNFVLILFKQSVKISELRQKKNASRVILLINKNVIYKEKIHL